MFFPPIVCIPFALDSLLLFFLYRYTHLTFTAPDLIILISALNIRFLVLGMTVLNHENCNRIARFAAETDVRLSEVEKVLEEEKRAGMVMKGWCAQAGILEARDGRMNASGSHALETERSTRAGTLEV